jgi:hypothetical protein
LRQKTCKPSGFVRIGEIDFEQYFGGDWLHGVGL